MSWSRAKKDIGESWLRQRYLVDLASVEEIASDAGCSVPTIRKWLRKWGIRRGKSFIKGKPAWNSGLTKEDDERLARLSEARKGAGNPRYGVSPWNAGLTKEDHPSLLAVSEKASARDFSPETRLKMAEAKRGKKGADANAWKGGFYKRGGAGYDMIRAGGKKVYLHRHIAETLLLRPLGSDEHVHHVDGDRQNNHPNNLLVLHSEAHTALHRALGVDPSIDQERWLAANGHHYEKVL